MSEKGKNKSHVTIKGEQNIIIGGNVSGSNIIIGDHNKIREDTSATISDAEIVQFIENKMRLPNSLSQGLSLSEITKISFELGIDYDHLIGGTKGAIITSLLVAIEKRELFPKFLQILKRLRPDVFEIVMAITLDKNAG